MRNYYLLAFLLLPATTYAQSAGTVNLVGPSTTPGAPQITTVATVNSAINTALTAKADASNGVLTSPSITGGTISGAPISGATGAFTTLSASGTLGVTGAATFGGAVNVTVGGTSQPLSPLLSGITYGVRADSPSTPAAGGTGNAAGDALTLSVLGCSVSPVLSVIAVSAGAVTQYGVTNPGMCPAVPSAGSVSVASTTGSGTGATFNLSWGLIAAAPYVGTLTQNGGNAYYTNPSFSPRPGLSGTENSFFGYGAGGAFTGASNFNTAMGHNACGIGGTPGLGGNNSCFGTDAGRNLSGGNNIATFGGFALHDQTIGTVGNLTAVGPSAMTHLNGGNGAQNDVGVGPNACAGVSGSATFRNGVCLGTNTGGALTSAVNFTIIGTGVGNTTFAGGNDVLLIGTGSTAVDTLAASSTHYMNIGNALIGGLVAPTVLTGFGTSPSVTGGTTSAAFTVNVGTGGTASSGTVNTGINAPNGYICQAVDITNPATADTVATPSGQANVVLTNYSRTTGTLTAWAASDVIAVTCNGY